MKKHAHAVVVPDWAKDAVWYQIFPERFRNGDPRNDPTPEDIDSHVNGRWAICPWGMDWYRQMDWETEMGPFYRSVYARRFGGDLIGIREKLDYLEELGVNAIYLNPVFTAPSLHKYDGSTFHHVDPTLGPDREGDLKAIRNAQETEDPATWIWTSADLFLLDLIRDIHCRGMRIILDGVFNHTGRRFFAFEDLLRHGRSSRYVDWYEITRWKRDGGFEYKGWFNHQGLPELKRNHDSLSDPVRRYVFDITRRWMDPNGDGDPSDGIDGWRLDVAFCVPHGFWKEWRRLVKSINPDAYITGEIVSLATEYLQGDEFDAVMNYMWLFPSADFFSPGKKPLAKAEFIEKLEIIRREYPVDVGYVLQNLLDSHDVARILSMLENPDIPKAHWDDYFNASRVKSHAHFATVKPGPRAVQALRQLTIFQMTYIGAPMVYYGTEVGMWGANDPDNRQPMFWDDIPLEPEQHAHDGSFSTPAKRAPDHELYSFFKRAIALRKNHRLLSRGSLHWIDTSSERLLGFERRDGDARIVVLLNAADEPAFHTVKTPVRDIWMDATVEGRISIDPRGWRILTC